MATTTKKITATLEPCDRHPSCTCGGSIVFRAWDGERAFQRHAISSDSDAERVLAHWEGFRSTYEPRPGVGA